MLAPALGAGGRGVQIPICPDQDFGVIDASGGFSQTQVDMGVVRMQQAGVV